MSQHFDPRKALRQVSNTLLKQFFGILKVPLDIKWDEISETAIEPIFQAWQELQDGPRREVEVVLQDIHAMANEDGVKVLVQDGDTWGKDLRDDLDKWESRYDKAMWTFLKHHDVWSLAVQFARADRLEGTRPWVKRANVPKRTPKTDAEACAELETSLCAYYRKSEGRGHCCKVLHHLRARSLDYFFVNLSDYADTYDKLDPEKNDFVRESEQRAFAVVFVYEQKAGTLDVYAKGGKKVVTPLQEIFARVILGVELAEEDDGQPYQLRLLLNPKFGFPVEAGDRVDHVRLRRVRLSVKGNHKRRVTLEANPDAGPGDIYDMMANYLNQANLPVAVLDVDQATLSFRLKHDGGGRPPSFSFNLSQPDGCNLKSLREEYREVGEKYLRKWKIDCG